MSLKPIVVAARAFPPAVEARLQRDYEARLNPEDNIHSSDALLELSEGADALMVTPSEKISAEFVGKLPETVKIVASFSVGYDHIDVDACRARGIAASNTPDVLNEATADIALLLLLAASRRAHEAADIVRNNCWTGWKTTMLLGVQMTGKRLGILGMGRIGQAVARRARGFGMNIHYHNRSRLRADLELDAVYHDTPESLLAVSDFLSINCPSTPETHKLIDHDRLALMPPNAVLVNTARGDIVDDDALIGALTSKRVAAAGLDVFDGEPNIHPGYRELENVFLLPHIGSATVETRDAMGFTALDNIDAALAGRDLPTPLWSR